MRALEGAAGRSVIIDPAFIGDNVFDGVLARALKVRDPDAHVGLVVRHPLDAVARYMPHVDAIHVYDKRGRDAGWHGLSRMASELRSARYDRAYVVHPSARSVWLAHRAGIAERRGFARGWIARWSLTHRTGYPHHETFTQERLRLLDAARTWPSSLTSLRGVLQARASAAPAGVRLGLVVGSEVATKRWPVERAAELIAKNQRSGWVWVLIGSPRERPLSEALLARLGGADGVDDRVGEGLDALVPRIAGLDLVVGGDTGPVFIARALGVPTVGLFGPTPEARHQVGPHDRVITASVPCRPCSPHGPRRCPKRHHRCLRGLEGEQVLRVTRALLRITTRGVGNG